MRSPLAIALALFLSLPARASDLKLWYDHPGDDTIRPGKPLSGFMTQGLPIGNGRIGGMVMGIPAHDHFQFNEDSLWTGSEQVEGSYQAFGDVFVDLPGLGKIENYRRDLDIGDAVAHMVFRSNGVTYTREYIASHKDDVIVIRMTADKPGSYTGAIRLTDAHRAKLSVDGNRLTASGTLDNGLKYESQVLVLPDGCKASEPAAAKGSPQVAFSGCDGLTLILAAGTDYLEEYAKHFRGPNPHERLLHQADAASQKPYAQLKADHIQDFQALFNRVALDLGPTPASARDLPTDKRIEQAAAHGDPELERLLFQYGRYNLIASSRDALPANLQGLWNDSNDQAWGSDYHANINVQMCYWPAETANLAETALPLFRLIDSQIPAWRKATLAEPSFRLPGGKDPRGWAIRTSHNIYGHTDWKWDKSANAWYAQHFWEHYAFTGDKVFLRDTAYPLMKEIAQFWQDQLKRLPDGRLVVPQGWSPEHGPVQDGVSYNQEIVWDLFDNYVHAADALGVDRAYRDQVAELRDHLLRPGVGSWGQFMEWMTELKDPVLDTPNDHHRHVSMLFGFYPGHQFDAAKDPALAKAAQVSLLARGETGDSRRQWVWAWRTALWARLGNADKAHEMILDFFKFNMLPNMIGTHPPQQWDGNFGITAAMIEMLLQSQTGEIQILPALPVEWKTGSVKGLVARGGFTVDLAWKDGKLSDATVHSTWGTGGRLRYGAKVVDLKLKPGQTVHLPASAKSK
jgi:alpha-L-fucosidase 2